MRGARRISPGGGSIVSSQHRAGAEGEGLPLDGELRENLKATYLKPLRDAEREMRAGRRSRLSRTLGAMPTMGAQSKPAALVVAATRHETLTAADVAVRDNPAVGGVANSVNCDFLDKLSFVDDRQIASLGLGAGGTAGGCQLWSAEEDTLLADLFPDYRALVAALPGRSYFALRNRAQRPCLTKRRLVWTNAAVSRLRHPVKLHLQP